MQADIQAATATVATDEAPGSLMHGRLLTVQDMAAILNCSARTVYRLVDSGKMPPPCRLGGLVRWSRAAIDAWIADGCPACGRGAAGRKSPK